MPEENEEETNVVTDIDSGSIATERDSLQLRTESATRQSGTTSGTTSEAPKEAPYGYTKDGKIKKAAGRPRKDAVQAKKQGNRGRVGRPKGDAAIINEYKARMLASPQSRQVLQSIMDAATNDEHKHQAAAWKLVMDRILPVAAFEKDVVKGGGGRAIEIKISGVPGVEINGKDTAMDADWTPVEEQ